ncbi:FAD-binding oxidoreductase [Kiritimatiellota bacterium B12222]|nr:FAD-binding oxidoreductase [Kiritimatiellota bacterium B12222]
MSTPTSWGNLPHTTATLLPVNRRKAAFPAVEDKVLPYGLGRSYGDSCLNDKGTLLLTRGMDRWISFDEETGIICCEAGVSLDEILRLASPKGWFLPVTPGTRFVTVGGAIANDVHGKNHHKAGSFSTCVLDFELLRSDQSRTLCSRSKNASLFHATIAGLGLTGLITFATLQLRRIVSPMIEVEQIRMHHLNDFFRLADESNHSHEYTVAWIDGLARGESVGSGIFIRGNHASEASDLSWKAKKTAAIPLNAPSWLLQKQSVKIFNALYSKKVKGERQAGSEHFLPFFYPLDAVDNWNRLYGKRGFYQYQCVVPRDGNRGPIHEILDRIANSGQASFLAVLKVFGDQKPEGLLSFARAGVTLAMDFPNRGPKTLKLMNELDEVVRQAGGALYPAKDARMNPEDFKMAYPALNTFTEKIDPAFSSSFWRRMHT